MNCIVFGCEMSIKMRKFQLLVNNSTINVFSKFFPKNFQITMCLTKLQNLR